MNRSHCATIESLETRRMLAAAAYQLIRGALYITGTNNDDTIVLRLNSKLFTSGIYAGVRKFVINGRGGNDLIRIDFGSSKLNLRALITGGAGDDTIYGSLGNDTVLGGDGNDLIHGRGGNDNLGGGNGADQLFGGDGADTIISNQGDDTLKGGNGDDYLQTTTGQAWGDDGNDFLVGSSYMHGMSGNDTLQCGNHPGAVVTGGPGDDVLIGSDAGETLGGGSGNDFIDGRGGNDSVYGGSNETGDMDTVHGGDGDDTVWGGFGGGPGTQLYGDAGNDTIQMTDDTVSVFGGDGNDNISAYQPDTWLVWHNCLIDGGDGNDIISGGLGDDTLLGGAGDDSIIDTHGQDQLFGGDGIDTLDASDGEAGDYLEAGSASESWQHDPDDTGDFPA